MLENFFDTYPWFYSSSRVGSHPNRLNRRFDVLIRSNLDCVIGKRVLDIASHDGRWSLAALAMGASHVTGVEARTRLIESSRGAVSHYQFPSSSYNFIEGDVHKVLADLEPGLFDTAFCFGFLYHTSHHLALLGQIFRLGVTELIVDTAVTMDGSPTITLIEEDSTHEANALRVDGSGQLSLAGTPSRSALEMLLRHAGFVDPRYLDWTRALESNAASLQAYVEGRRVSVRAARPETSMSSR